MKIQIRLNSIFKPLVSIAVVLLLLVDVTGMQSIAQTRKYTSSPCKTVPAKKGYTQRNNLSGNRAANSSKKPATQSTNKNDVLYINYGESKTYIGDIVNGTGYSTGFTYAIESITGTYKNSVVRNKKPMTIEYNINLGWPRDLNQRNQGYSNRIDLSFIREIQYLIKERLLSVGIPDVITSNKVVEVVDGLGIQTYMEARVDFLKSCEQIIKNTITVSVSISHEYALVRIQETNVDVNGKTKSINQIAKISPDVRIFSPLSETLDSKPEGITEYICNDGYRKLILGIPDTNNDSAKLPYYQYATHLHKEKPHTLKMSTADNNHSIVLEEYDDSGKLIKKFILDSVIGDRYEGNLYDLSTGEKWDIGFAARKY